MPLDLASSAAIISDAEFRDRVGIAMYWVARGVIENAEDPAMGYERRYAFARSIILAPHEELQRYVTVVVTDNEVRASLDRNNPKPADLTDQVITDALNRAWNGLADVRFG